MGTILCWRNEPYPMSVWDSNSIDAEREAGFELFSTGDRTQAGLGWSFAGILQCGLRALLTLKIGAMLQGARPLRAFTVELSRAFRRHSGRRHHHRWQADNDGGA